MNRVLKSFFLLTLLSLSSFLLCAESPKNEQQTKRRRLNVSEVLNEEEGTGVLGNQSSESDNDIEGPNLEIEAVGDAEYSDFEDYYGNDDNNDENDYQEQYEDDYQEQLQEEIAYVGTGYSTPPSQIPAVGIGYFDDAISPLSTHSPGNEGVQYYASTPQYDSAASSPQVSVSSSEYSDYSSYSAASSLPDSVAARFDNLAPAVRLSTVDINNLE